MSETAHAPAHGAQGIDEVQHAHDHGPVQHQFDDLDQQRESFSLGMWLFLATELMMFGGLFFAYSLYRTHLSDAFHIASQHQNVFLGTVNTFVLLTSSLTMAMAVGSAARQETRRMVMFLVITWLFGLAFLVIKGFEWGHDFTEGLIPGVNWSYYAKPENAHAVQELADKGVGVHQIMMFWVLYFCMTGLHAIHMIIGLLVVGTVIILGARRRFENGNDQPVEIVGLYWHLVDIIWIFLFPLLYLIAGFHPATFFGKGGH